MISKQLSQCIPSAICECGILSSVIRCFHSSNLHPSHAKRLQMENESVLNCMSQKYVKHVN